MDEHFIAWEAIKEQLFGTVCEVTRTKPWGFIHDKPDITNLTAGEFLKDNRKWGTVILHILSGEGVPEKTVLSVVKKAITRGVKVIILEHSPPIANGLDYISNFVGMQLGTSHYPDASHGRPVGRNIMWSFNTLSPLILPELNDQYIRDNIGQTYVTELDHGICSRNLIYTHTSEAPIDFPIPKGRTGWVIGGGIPYESMREGDILFDSVLRQCLYAASLYGVEQWKLDMIYKFHPIEERKSTWGKHWRKVTANACRPHAIHHVSLQSILPHPWDNSITHVYGCENLYVSTVHKDYWGHISDEYNILEAWSEPRDMVKLHLRGM